MSIRRRNVRARVERDRRLALERATMDASLARMKRVLDDAQSQGLKSLSQSEFWRRFHELAKAEET